MNKKRGLLKTIRILLFIAILVLMGFLTVRYIDIVKDEQEASNEYDYEYKEYNYNYINEHYSNEKLVSELIYSINNFINSNEMINESNLYGINIKIPSEDIHYENDELYWYYFEEKEVSDSNKIESVLEKLDNLGACICIRSGDLYVKDFLGTFEFYPKESMDSMLDSYVYKTYISLIEKYNYLVNKYNDSEIEVSITVISGNIAFDSNIYLESSILEGENEDITNNDFGSTKLIIGLIILIFAILVYALTSIRYVKINILQKIKSEIFIAIGLITLITAGYLIDQINYMLYKYNEVDIDEFKKLICACIIILFLLFYACFRECILKIKEKTFLNNSVIVKGIKKTINLYTNNSSYSKLVASKKASNLKYAYVVFSVIYWLLFLITAMLLELNDEDFMVVYSIIWTAIYIASLVVKIGYENKYLKEIDLVFDQIDNMCEGDYEPMEKTSNIQINEIVSRLNSISSGFEEAVDKRLTSEKMKIELITNVSHDLKTPLTSIISYVDLLKNEDISDVAKDYVQILEDKSNNLKNIVSDIFEMAKASSKDKVKLEEIDGSMLIRQVMADMSDTIEKSGKIIREDITPEVYMIKGDGKRLYRALQNVIDNAIKYAMDGTRIYINSSAEDDKFCINIKNISYYEMDFTEEEILERFSRGDKSRTTEGNGLGLAIAKSFVEASGGYFKIIIDGDVFSVIIVLSGNLLL